jgi:hypothetical protein
VLAVFATVTATAVVLPVPVLVGNRGCSGFLAFASSDWGFSRSGFSGSSLGAGGRGGLGDSSLLAVLATVTATTVVLPVSVLVGNSGCSGLLAFAGSDWGFSRGSLGRSSLSASGWGGLSDSGLLAVLAAVTATTVVLPVSVLVGNSGRSGLLAFASGDGGFGRGSFSGSGLSASGRGDLGDSSLLAVLPAVTTATVVLPVPALVGWGCGASFFTFTSVEHISKLAGNLFESLGVLEFTNVVSDGLFASLDFHVGIASEERVGLFKVISKNTGRSNDNSGEERDGCRETHSDNV